MTVLQAAAGWRHSAVVGTDGGLWTWGWGGSVGSNSALFPSHISAGGQLGHDNEFDYWKPTRVEQLDRGGGADNSMAWRATQVACGLNHTAAVLKLL